MLFGPSSGGRSPRHCLVCLERPADVDARPSPRCAAGCGGRAAVCRECYPKLRKCVFCRSRIRYLSLEDFAEERGAADANPGPDGRHLACAIATMAALLALLMLMLRYKGGHARPDAPDAEDAFGQPVPFDADAPD